MKRKANRRALGVYLGIFLIYISLVLDLPKKLPTERVSMDREISLQTVMGREITSKREGEKFDIWPIFHAFVDYSVESGEIDQDCLILVRKGDTLEFKRPHEILKERNREGLKSLIRLVGKSKLISFLEKEGIKIRNADNIEEILIELSAYAEKEELKGLIEKGLSKGMHKEAFSQTENEWIMPDLRNLSLREAISKLGPFTSKIRVLGYGEVQDQEPKPGKRIYGETECVLYGNQK